jgi:ABC-2 type transport system permease protein
MAKSEAVVTQNPNSILWIINDYWELTRRSIRHIIRSLDQLMSLVMFPIMFMLLKRYVFGGAIDTGDVTYAN